MWRSRRVWSAERKTSFSIAASDPEPLAAVVVGGIGHIFDENDFGNEEAAVGGVGCDATSFPKSRSAVMAVGFAAVFVQYNAVFDVYRNLRTGTYSSVCR